MGTQTFGKWRRIMVLSISVASAFGCSSKSHAPPPNPVVQSQPAPEASPPPSYGPPGASAQAPSHGTGGKFYEFTDIPLPAQMKVQQKDSYIFQSGQIKMGFLTLRGRVDSNSAVNFFVSALPREGWRLKCQFRYGRSLLIFDKPDKVCAILVKEEAYYTYVEIYVSPVTGG